MPARDELQERQLDTVNRGAGRPGTKLLCPVCGGESDVRGSQPNPDRTMILRRRYCLRNSSHHFTTLEIPVPEEYCGRGHELLGKLAKDILLKKLEQIIKDVQAGR